jgi:hypothetical protein
MNIKMVANAGSCVTIVIPGKGACGGIGVLDNEMEEAGVHVGRVVELAEQMHRRKMGSLSDSLAPSGVVRSTTQDIRQDRENLRTRAEAEE